MTVQNVREQGGSRGEERGDEEECEEYEVLEVRLNSEELESRMGGIGGAYIHVVPGGRAVVKGKT